MRNKRLFQFIGLALLTLALQLGLLHGILGPVAHLLLYLAHLFALYIGVYCVAPKGQRASALYATGYVVLLVVFLVITRQPLLFPLFIVLYAGLYHVPGAVGYLFIFVFSFALFSPFSFPLFISLSLFYAGARWLIVHQSGLLLLACYALGFALFTATLLPMLNMSMLVSFQDLTKSLGLDYVRDSLKLSLLSFTISTAVVLILGIPLGYVMARRRFRGHSIADTLIDVPILIPQPIVGIALLSAVGPKTLIGKFLWDHFSIEVAGSIWGICAAQVCVSSPFLVRAAMSAFQGVDEKLEYVAQTLGAGPVRTFCAITLPLASKGIFYGAILSWARAISEFGSLSVIAYKPATAPVMIYDVFTQYGTVEARPMSVLLVIVCLWAFIALRVLRAWSPQAIVRKLKARTDDTYPQPQPNLG